MLDYELQHLPIYSIPNQTPQNPKMQTLQLKYTIPALLLTVHFSLASTTNNPTNQITYTTGNPWDHCYPDCISELPCGRDGTYPEGCCCDDIYHCGQMVCNLRRDGPKKYLKKYRKDSKSCRGKGYVWFDS